MKLTKNDTKPSTSMLMKGQSLYTGDEYREISRISQQNKLLNRIASRYLDDLFSLYENPAVLDVGCSDGANILKRLKGRQYHSLIGIDRNEKKIEVANVKNKARNTTFLCCDISTNDLDVVLSSYLNLIGKDGFDIIHISSVLLHIDHPDIFLKRIRTFLSERGRIFIQDEDDGLNSVYPYEESFDDCFYVWEHSIEAGDRFMGGKIPFFLEKGGYSDIKILSTSATSVDFNGVMKDCLWDMYFNSDFWVANDVSFYDKTDAYDRFLSYQEKHSALREAYMNGQYFVMLGIFFIVASK